MGESNDFGEQEDAERDRAQEQEASHASDEGTDPCVDASILAPGTDLPQGH